MCDAAKDLSLRFLSFLFSGNQLFNTISGIHRLIPVLRPDKMILSFDLWHRCILYPRSRSVASTFSINAHPHLPLSPAPGVVLIHAECSSEERRVGRSAASCGRP